MKPGCNGHIKYRWKLKEKPRVEHGQKPVKRIDVDGREKQHP